MLIGFKVKNFKSFKDLQHFSLLAGKVRNNENHIVDLGKYKILKFSGMYGANGSGKSNFGMALFDILFHLTQKYRDYKYFQNYTYGGSTKLFVVF